MFGGGAWEGGSCEEKDADFAGKLGSPLNGDWRWKGGADDTISTSPCVLGTLALEDAVKVQASIAQRDAGGVGRRLG